MNMIGGIGTAFVTCIVAWFVFCGAGGALRGLGTQRLPDPNRAQGDDVSDVSQFFFAYLARISGDASKTFMKDEARGPIAGTNGDTSAQPLPIDYRTKGSTKPGAAPDVKALGASMSGAETVEGATGNDPLMNGQEVSLEQLKAAQNR